ASGDRRDRAVTVAVGTPAGGGQAAPGTRPPEPEVIGPRGPPRSPPQHPRPAGGDHNRVRYARDAMGATAAVRARPDDRQRPGAGSLAYGAATRDGGGDGRTAR